MKTCSRCEIEQPTENFSKDRSCKDGLRRYCRACAKHYKSSWYEKNGDHARAYGREYQASWREQNPDYNKEWLSQNPDYHRQWNYDNRLRRQEGYSRRRAQKRNTTVEPFTCSDIFARDNWICGICESVVDSEVRHPDPLSPSLDHVIPLSKGGTHTPDNVQLAHLSCNQRKGAKWEEVK